MVDVDLVTHKLSDLQHRLERVRGRRASDGDALRAAPDAMELVCFNLMLAVQGCIDIAAHICVDEGWGVPENARHGFEQLAAHGVIPPNLLPGIRATVGLRSIVAHAYGRIDPDIVHAASTDEGLAVIEDFMASVARWAAAPR